MSLFLAVVIWFSGYVVGWKKDLVISAIIIVTLFFLYKQLRLTPFVYSMVCASLIVHNLGAFNFYSVSPLSQIPYDNITHLLGIFSATLLIANFLSPALSKTKRFRLSNFIMLFMIFFAGLGIGAVIESLEFSGYLLLGSGEGVLQFGYGDFDGFNETDDLTQIVGGGYFDTMSDLIFNMIGALIAVILFAMIFFVFKKERV